MLLWFFHPNQSKLEGKNLCRGFTYCLFSCTTEGNPLYIFTHVCNIIYQWYYYLLYQHMNYIYTLQIEHNVLCTHTVLKHFRGHLLCLPHRVCPLHMLYVYPLHYTSFIQQTHWYKLIFGLHKVFIWKYYYL